MLPAPGLRSAPDTAVGSSSSDDRRPQDASYVSQSPTHEGSRRDHGDAGTEEGAAPRSRRTRGARAGLRASRRRGPASRQSSRARTATPSRSSRSRRAARVHELVPIRYGRMLVSPFTFFRGAAPLMAARPRRDAALRSAPRSSAATRTSSNFGGFASPERTLVFDLNDFDETLPGPFEWDVKRLAASFEVAGRDRGFTDAQRRAARAPRSPAPTARRCATSPTMTQPRRLVRAARRREPSSGSARGATQAARSAFERTVAKARTKDSMKALREAHRGWSTASPGSSADPPLARPGARSRRARHDATRSTERDASSSAPTGARCSATGGTCSSSYRYVDIARKVVGVGSVGTRCWIVLLLGRDDGDPLFLQVKEAAGLRAGAGHRQQRFANHGQRVVEGQRLMQAASDIFLGWIRAEAGSTARRATSTFVSSGTGRPRSTSTSSSRGARALRQACGWTLARAHARSGDRIAIASYLGKSDVFDRAVADFAVGYADLNERDYAALATAARENRIEVRRGLSKSRQAVSRLGRRRRRRRPEQGQDVVGNLGGDNSPP